MSSYLMMFIAIISLLLIGLACDKDSTADKIVEPDESISSFDEPIKLEGDETYYLAVEKMPEIIGGIVSIQEHLRYPELAKRAGIAKFKPGEQRGQPVPVRVSIPVVFRLAS